MAALLPVFAFLAGVLSLASGDFGGLCTQRLADDYRADEYDCRRFYVCSLGRLLSFTCNVSSVFDERTKSCVPAYSSYDTCSNQMAIKQICRAGGPGQVAHPTQCAQYYDCGAGQIQSHPGLGVQLRECPHPLIFSAVEKKCVVSAPGICGLRLEPLDQCDYKVNQCEGHADCVPCSLRFPTCRGRPDGANAWFGRERSPYSVLCQQQRVVGTEMCEQKGAIYLFDDRSKTCVKEEQLVQMPTVQLQVPQGFRQSGTGPVSTHTEDGRQELPSGYVPF